MRTPVAENELAHVGVFRALPRIPHGVTKVDGNDPEAIQTGTFGMQEMHF